MADDPLGAVGWGLLVSFFQLFQQMMMIEFWDIWRLDMAYYYVRSFCQVVRLGQNKRWM